jgi:hypothetical protein
MGRETEGREARMAPHIRHVTHMVVARVMREQLVICWMFGV